MRGWVDHPYLAGIVGRLRAELSDSEMEIVRNDDED